MITLLHGENQTASRRALDKFRRSGSDVIVLDGKNFDQLAFVQAVASRSLLYDKKTVIVEGLLSSKKDWQPVGGVTCDLVFWEGKGVGKTDQQKLARLGKIQVEEFKIERRVFQLLDTISPGTGGKSIALLQNCLATDEAEFIFLMLVRQFRLLLCPGSATAWQENKLRSQRARFTPQKLTEIYRQLLNIDFRVKNGLSSTGLAGELVRLLLWI